MMIDTPTRNSTDMPLLTTPFCIETGVEYFPPGRLFFHIVPKCSTAASTRLAMLSEGHRGFGDDSRFECTVQAWDDAGPDSNHGRTCSLRCAGPPWFKPLLLARRFAPHCAGPDSNRRTPTGQRPKPDRPIRALSVQIRPFQSSTECKLGAKFIKLPTAQRQSRVRIFITLGPTRYVHSVERNQVRPEFCEIECVPYAMSQRLVVFDNIV